MVIQILSEQKHYPVSALCKITGISRSAYYKWRHRGKSQNELQNEKLLVLIREAYEKRDGILSYRQMTIKLRREHNLKASNQNSIHDKKEST